MDYEVFARRFRPRTFDEVTGQDTVVQTLCKAIGKNRIAHAFLFSGIRGCGKTTLARIMAKALNCRSAPGPTKSPCLTCEACMEIAAGQCMDVLEVDGASNRGIDQVRELRENIRYRPTRDRFKVYIIDEVHMLTTEAFNALLKTLEEPPEHVKFIFATTDFQRIPDTILSRCQHHEFKRIPPACIIEKLKAICAEDKITVSDSALARIVHAADGSLRDALSALDQVVSYAGESVTDRDVENTLGLIDDAILSQACLAVKNHDTRGVLSAVARLADAGHPFRRFCSALIERMRAYLVVMAVPTAPEILALTEDSVASLRKEAEGFSQEDLIRALQILLTAENEMKWAIQPRFLLEMALLKAARMRQLKPLGELMDRLKEIAAAGGGPTNLASAVSAESPSMRIQSLVPIEILSEEQARDLKGAGAPARGPDTVAAVLEAAVQAKPSLVTVESAVLKELRGTDLYLAFSSKSHKDLVDTTENREILRRALERATGTAGRITIEHYVAETMKPAGVPEVRSPEKAKADRLNDAAMAEPAVRLTLDLFKGRIVSVEDKD